MVAFSMSSALKAFANHAADCAAIHNSGYERYDVNKYRYIHILQGIASLYTVIIQYITNKISIA